MGNEVGFVMVFTVIVATFLIFAKARDEGIQKHCDIRHGELVCCYYDTEKGVRNQMTRTDNVVVDRCFWEGK